MRRRTVRERGQATVELVISLPFFVALFAGLVYVASVIYGSLAAYTAASDCAMTAAQTPAEASLYGLGYGSIPLVEDGYGVTFALSGVSTAGSVTCQVAYDNTVTIVDDLPTFNWTVEFNVPFQMYASWW